MINGNTLLKLGFKAGKWFKDAIIPYGCIMAGDCFKNASWKKPKIKNI